MGVALAALWGLVGGCRDQTTVPVDRNRAPETFLTKAPGDSQTTFYRIRLHWNGSDPDGEVRLFDVAVTESLPQDEASILWRRTQRHDSLITFAVEETREVLGHRFYVRAVDNEGRVDETPAWVFFGARDNLPPEVELLRAVAFGPQGESRTLTSESADFPTDTIPTGWGVSFAWTGRDGDVAIEPDGRVIQVGEVSRFFYRLLPVESEYLGGSVTDTSQTYLPGFFNRFPQGSVYAFNVRAVDDGGLSGTGRVTRSFVWNRDPVSRIQRALRPGTSDSVASFFSGDSLYVSGDTLPLPVAGGPLPSVRYRATAYDPDPIDGDHSVASMESRSVTGAIFNSWMPLPVGTEVELATLPTGDYVAMVRSVDRLDRVEGTPDSVLLYVNFAPRFVTRRDDLNFVQHPLPGDVFTMADVTQNGLTCNFLVGNQDATTGEQIRYGARFESDFDRELRSQAATQQTLPMNIVYQVIASPVAGWRPGAYRLIILAEDNRQSGGESARGIRSKERIVPFTVVDR